MESENESVLWPLIWLDYCEGNCFILLNRTKMVFDLGVETNEKIVRVHKYFLQGSECNFWIL